MGKLKEMMKIDDKLKNIDESRYQANVRKVRKGRKSGKYRDKCRGRK